MKVLQNILRHLKVNRVTLFGSNLIAEHKLFHNIVALAIHRDHRSISVSVILLRFLVLAYAFLNALNKIL